MDSYVECEICGGLFDLDGSSGSSIRQCQKCFNSIPVGLSGLRSYDNNICKKTPSCLCSECLSKYSSSSLFPSNNDAIFDGYGWLSASERKYSCHINNPKDFDLYCLSLKICEVSCTLMPNSLNDFLLILKGSSRQIQDTINAITSVYGNVVKECTGSEIAPSSRDDLLDFLPSYASSSTNAGSRFAFASDISDFSMNLEFPSIFSSNEGESQSIASYVDSVFGSSQFETSLLSMSPTVDATPSNLFHPINTSNSLQNQESSTHPCEKEAQDRAYADVHYDDMSSSSSSEVDNSVIMVQKMECPADRVKLIIGSKGSVIKKIMQLSKTMINVQEIASSEGVHVVEIKGTLLTTNNAKQLIQRVIDQGPSFLEISENMSPSRSNSVTPASPDRTLEGSSILTSYYFCPSDKVSIVIGSKGVIIKEISKRSNAQISIAEETKSSDDGVDGEPQRKIEIKGSSAEIDSAKALILAVVQHGPGALFSQSMTSNQEQSSLYAGQIAKITHEIPCPKEKVGAVIGSKGSVVRDLIKQSNTVISVGDDIISVPVASVPFISHHASHVEVRMITVRGFPNDVSKAKLLIENILKSSCGEDDSMFPDPLTAIVPGPIQVTETLVCPGDRVGEIIGWRGSIVKGLCNSSGAKIVLVDDPVISSKNKIIELKGTHDQVSKAKSLVCDILLNRTKGKSSEDDLPSASFSAKQFFSIGPNVASILKTKYSSLIDDVSKQYGVEISLEREKLELSCSDIDGLKACVSRIQQVVDDAMRSESSDSSCKSEVIECPFEKVYLFVGKRGLSALNDISLKSGASLSVLKPFTSSRKIIIQGVSDNLMKAKKIVMDMLTSTKKKDVAHKDFAFSKISAQDESESELENNSDSSDMNHGESSDYHEDDSDDYLDDKDNNTNLMNDLEESDEDDDDDEENDDEDDEEEDEDDDDEDSEESNSEVTSDDWDEDNNRRSESRISIPCPNDKVGLIIGSKGIVIKSMMNRSKAKILVTSEIQNGKTVRNVEISGTEKQVKEARSMVETVIRHGQVALDLSGDASLGLGIMTKYVDLAMEKIRMISGPKASVLRAIQKESKASIMVGKKNKEDDSSATLRRISIKGTVEEVEAALTLLEDVFSRGKMPSNTKHGQSKNHRRDRENDSDNDETDNRHGDYEDQDYSTTEGLNSDSNKLYQDSSSGNEDFHHLPSRGSSSSLSSSFQSSSNVGMFAHTPTRRGSRRMNDSDNANDSPRIPNSRSLNSSPRTPARRSTPLSRTLNCPMSKVGSLIGTRGTVIREIMKRTNTIIVVGDVPDPSSGKDFRVVTIRGNQSGVLEAESLVSGIIEHGTKVLSSNL